MKILYKDLVRLGACPAGRRQFQRMFGRGGEVTLERVQQWESRVGLLSWVPYNLLDPRQISVYKAVYEETYDRVGAFYYAASFYDRPGEMG